MLVLPFPMLSDPKKVQSRLWVNLQIFSPGTSIRVLLPTFSSVALLYVLHSAVGGATLVSWHPLGFQSSIRAFLPSLINDAVPNFYM